MISLLYNNNQEMRPMRLSPVKEKGTDRGDKKKGTEGERLKERGQDEEKCWFEGGQEEMWTG